MAHYTGENPYVGEENLVIAIDLGTTHSAVAYSYLYPDDLPRVRLVNKWPGQPEASGDSKIPTIAAYQAGRGIAFGAEARDFVGDEDYQIAQWFKLHLHPDSMKFSEDHDPKSGSNKKDTLSSIEIPALPNGVTLLKVYSDFLGYLYRTTRSFFQENNPNGHVIWARLETKLTLILCTPNGWDSDQQAFLRKAVIDSRIMSSEAADRQERLDFVTEGEASVHYALAHTKSQSWLDPGVMFMVTDAGGSTVDSTLYECKGTEPKLLLQEVCASECVQAGGVFVDRAARTMFETKLENSKFNGNDFINRMVEGFEKKTKRIFDGTQDSNIIQFGFNSDNDRAHGIMKGKISLKRDDVEASFTEVLDRIVGSCSKLLTGRRVKHLLLVGGFGESPYLFSRLNEEFKPKGTEVVTVEEPSKKAAAEGAAIWYIKHLVVARRARFTIGCEVRPAYDPALPEHRERRLKVVTSEDGHKRLEGAFSIWVNKNTLLEENAVKLFDRFRLYNTFPQDLGEFSVQVFVWEGAGTSNWVKGMDGNVLSKMRRLCKLNADLSKLRSAVRVMTAETGARYWRVDYKVAVIFGGTQIKARLQWYEAGKLQEGPIELLPNAAY